MVWKPPACFRKKVMSFTGQHVNNANYIRMAMELLPEDFVVKGLRVEYRVAAKLGDSLTLFQIENGFIIALAIGNEASAIVEFTT